MAVTELECRFLWGDGRLLEIIQPNDDGPVVVLEAYIDESERKSGVFCVAGYVFTPKHARSLAAQWPPIFGGRTFHMTDLANREKEFSDVTPEEANKMIREAVALVAKKFTLGRAVSLDLNEAREILPHNVIGFRHPYSILCTICARAIGSEINNHFQDDDSVAYVFEAGHRYEGEAREWVKEARREDKDGTKYRMKSDAFVPKTESILLQAADLLAWEYAKYIDETVLRPIRKPRKSLMALLAGNIGRYEARHYNRDGLQSIAAEMRSAAQPIRR